VREQVVAQQPGVGQTVAFADERMEGTQRVAFEQLEGGVGVALELDYRLTGVRFAAALLDALFIRRAIRDSLRRTLERFGRELAAELELLR
jgi:uncharacterized membrane protein